MNNSRRVTFVGCIKNSETFLTSVLSNVEKMCSFFDHHAFIFIENDSSDNTVKLLRDFGNGKNHFLLYTLNGLDNLFTARTVRLEICRNMYLTALKESTLISDSDVVVMMDMDDVNSMPLDEKCFAKALSFLDDNESLAAVTAVPEGKYYDLWALRHNKFFDRDIWEDVIDLLLYENMPGDKATEKIIDGLDLSFISRDKPTIVESAFGGLALYKHSAIKKNPFLYLGQKTKYIFNENGNFFRMQQCEHVNFNLGFKYLGMKIAIHPELKIFGYGNRFNLNSSAARSLIIS